MSDIPKNPNPELLKFGEKVFSYSLHKFGVIYKESVHSPLFSEEIGNAVVLMQFHIRDILRDHFWRGIEKMIGVIDSNQRSQAIQHLLYFRSDQFIQDCPIHKILFGYLAMITELIIFMDSMGLPTRLDWFMQMWAFIYDTRLKEKFGSRWEALKKEAKITCDACPQKEQLLEELKSLEHPYAEIDPRIETPFKELDPFVFCTLGTDFEMPIKPGLSNEATEKLLQERAIADDI